MCLPTPRRFEWSRRECFATGLTLTPQNSFEFSFCLHCVGSGVRMRHTTWVPNWLEMGLVNEYPQIRDFATSYTNAMALEIQFWIPLIYTCYNITVHPFFIYYIFGYLYSLIKSIFKPNKSLSVLIRQYTHTHSAPPIHTPTRIWIADIHITVFWKKLYHAYIALKCYCFGKIRRNSTILLKKYTFCKNRTHTVDCKSCNNLKQRIQKHNPKGFSRKSKAKVHHCSSC